MATEIIKTGVHSFNFSHVEYKKSFLRKSKNKENTLLKVKFELRNKVKLGDTLYKSARVINLSF